jgi:hypothetical protein
MNANTRKNISVVFLWIAIFWFAAILIFESRYLISVFRQQATLRDVLGTIYEEQIEGINFVMLLVYLIPGLFSLVMYSRFKQSY